MNHISPIETFSAILVSLGHACAPDPRELDKVRAAELVGDEFETLTEYMKIVISRYERESRATTGPAPVVPEFLVPPRIRHVTCTGRTEVTWTPGRTELKNLDGNWDYDSSFWTHIDEDVEVFPEDLMIRMILLYSAFPGTDLGGSFRENNQRLYKKALAKFREHNMEWYEFLVANASDRLPIERQMMGDSQIESGL